MASIAHHFRRLVLYFQNISRLLLCVSIALPAAPAVAANSTRTRLIAVSPSPAGSPVTLTAEVDAPAGVGGATGRVSFTDGERIVGSALVNALGGAQTSLSLGLAHACALASPSGVECWGWNKYGQLGDGATTDHLPAPVTGLTKRVVALAVGGVHSCALTVEGAVICWGENSLGQLGGPTPDRAQPAPTPVPGLSSGVIAIASGSYHSCAVTEAGAIFCWGRNVEGQIGNGVDLETFAPPTRVGGPAEIYTDVAGGASHSCGLTNAGAVLCWGQGFGKVPTPVAKLGSGVVALTAGSYHDCALTKAGAVQCWGPAWNAGAPTPVAGLSSGVVAISSGSGHDCALLRDGGVRCWGYNQYGQLGDGTTTDRTIPTPVLNLGAAAVAIAAGFDFSCALLSTRAVKCWGYNEVGEIGDGGVTNQPLPVPAKGLSALLRTRARLTTSTLGNGLHALRANYLGDAAHAPSQSTPLPMRLK
ncbi:chromosome condensation regulator RCC1 [Methylosinus trichosporium OB3b]|uniref:Chromosome condensation regulator RCC1 n=1 Tax=Methylosinus trichosporium (strain ATCC 35070 / NCIMB 11131 / UNIQEM 75 / OB3b) TaxID=595536 RepID=A0A2D2D600_METT3|nr:chromosome condensation regulator RCC1 [Methylosinus trichosporium OB3b]